MDRSSSRTFGVSAVAAAVLAGLLSASALAGHLTGSELLRKILGPDYSMRPSAAFSFILAAVVVILLTQQRLGDLGRRVSVVLSMTILLAATLAIVDLTTHLDISLEALLLTNGELPTDPISRTMAPVSALLFVIVALSFLGIDKEIGRVPVAVTGFSFVAVATLLPIFGYLYGVPFDPARVVPLPGALPAFLLIAAGGLLTRPQTGWIKVIRSPHIGGVVARQLLPVAILVPVVLGWGRLLVRKLGLVSSELSTALLVFLIVILTVTFVIGAATVMNRRDVARQEAEERFRTLIEQSPDAMLLIDRDNTIRYASSVAERLFGYGSEELDGANYSLLFPVQSREEHVASISAFCEAEGESLSSRHVHSAVRGDGTVFEVEIALSTAASATSTEVIATLRDVTERKAMEDALRRSESHLAQAQRVARLGSWIWHIETNELTWSEETYRIFRLPLGSPVDFTLFLSHIPADERSKVEQSVAATLDGGEPYEIEHRIIVGEGEERFVLEKGELTRDDSGEPSKMVGTVQDLTEAKRAQEVMARSEALLSQTQEVSKVGGWEFEVRTGLLRWTEQVYAIYEVERDFDPNDVRRAIQFYAPEDQPRIEARFEGAVKRGEPYDLELKFITARGRNAWVRTGGRPELRDGEVVRVYGYIQDVTERKEWEEILAAKTADLERSNQELEQFAYVASHDLQEPLRMVSSYTQLLAKRYGGSLDQDAHDFINFAVDGANRMQRLINDLLTYSRIGTRGGPQEPVDSHAALGRALANLRSAIDESNALISNEDLPVVLADESQLVQLFQNLIGNAIKFRRPGHPPRVHVTAQREENEWIFSVQDNGIGIAEEFHSRLFVIFQRLHRRDEYPGTGIGLALCKRIVDRHGGRIWLTSKPGSGTTFFFTLTTKVVEPSYA